MIDDSDNEDGKPNRKELTEGKQKTQGSSKDEAKREETKAQSLDPDEPKDEANELNEDAKESKEREEEEKRIDSARKRYGSKNETDKRDNEAKFHDFIESSRAKKPNSQITYPHPIIAEQPGLMYQLEQNIRYNPFVLHNWINLLKGKFKKIIEGMPIQNSQYNCMEPILAYADENELALLFRLERIENIHLTRKDFEMQLWASLGIPDCATIAAAQRQIEEENGRRERMKDATPKVADTEPIANFVQHFTDFTAGKPETAMDYTQINCKENAMLAERQANLRSTSDYLVALNAPMMSGIIAAIILEMGKSPYHRADSWRLEDSSEEKERPGDEVRDHTIQWTCIGCGTPNCHLHSFSGFYINGSSINQSEGFRASGAICSKGCALRVLLRAIEEAKQANETRRTNKREHSSPLIKLVLNETKLAYAFQVDQDKADQHAIKQRVGNRNVDDLKQITKTFETTIDNLKKDHGDAKEDVLLVAEFFFPILRKVREVAKQLNAKIALVSDKTKKPDLTDEMRKNTEKVEEAYQQLFNAKTPLTGMLKDTRELLNVLDTQGLSSNSGGLEHPYIKIGRTNHMRQIAANLTKIGTFFDNGISPLLAELSERLDNFNKEVGTEHTLRLKRDADCVRNIFPLLKEIEQSAEATIELHRKAKKIYHDETQRFLKRIDLREDHDFFMWLKTQAAEDVGKMRLKLETDVGAMRQKLEVAEKELDYAARETILSRQNIEALERNLRAAQIAREKREEEKILLESREMEIARREIQVAEFEAKCENAISLFSEKEARERFTAKEELAAQIEKLAKDKKDFEKEKMEALKKIPKKDANAEELTALRADLKKAKDEMARYKAQRDHEMTTLATAHKESLQAKNARIEEMQKAARTFDLTDSNKGADIKRIEEKHAQEMQTLINKHKQDSTHALTAQRKIEAAQDKKMKELEDKLAKQDDQISRQQADNHDIASECESVKSALAALEEKYDKQKTFNKALEDRKEQYKQKEAKALKDLDEAYKRLKATQDAAKKNQEEVQTLLQENKVLRSRPEGTPQDSDNLQKNAKDIKAKEQLIVQLQQAISHHKASNLDYEQRIHKLYAENLRLGALQEDLYAEIKQAHASCEQVHLQLNVEKSKSISLEFENRRLKQADMEQKQFQINQQIKDQVKHSLRSLTPDTTTESQKSQASESLMQARPRSMSADGRPNSRIESERQSSSSQQIHQSSSSSSSLMPPPRTPVIPYSGEIFVRSFDDKQKTREPARSGRSRERSRERSHERNERSKSRGASPLATNDAAALKLQLQEEAENSRLLRAQIEEMKAQRLETNPGYPRREGDSIQKREHRESRDRHERDDQRREKRSDEKEDAQKREDRDNRDKRDKEKDDQRREKRRETKQEEDRDKANAPNSEKQRNVLKKSQKSEGPEKNWCFHHWDEMDAGRDKGCTRNNCKFDHISERQPCWSWDSGCQRGDECKYKHVSEKEWRDKHPDYPQRPNQKRKAAPNNDGAQPSKKPDNRKNTPCRFYMKGSCQKGNECLYMHSDKREKKSKRNDKDDDDAYSSYDDTAPDRDPYEPAGKTDDRETRKR